MTSGKNIDIIIGLQYGDEGKGKIVKHYIDTEHYDWCIRFNGGPNAGHTIYLGDRKIVTHQIPTGIVRPGIKCWIASGCVVDLSKLKDEIDELTSAGIHDIAGRLFISPACHLITEENIAFDKANNAVGTTGSGIGPTYARKCFRTGRRIDHFIKKGLLKDIVFPFQFLETIPADEVASSKILLEGAQGFQLDIDWGQYPFVTACNCIAPYAMVSTGLPMKSVRNIIGIAKIYETYVGSNTFQGSDPELATLQQLGQEFGATTGRKRQTNWLNLRELAKAIAVNNTNKVIINKCDIMKECGAFKLIDREGMLKVFPAMLVMKRFIVEQLTNQFPDIEIEFSGVKNGL